MGTSTRILVVAFVLVVAAFIGSTLLVQHQAQTIDEEAARISRDIGPGIQVVSDLRAEVREVEETVSRTVDTGGPPDEVAQARRRVDVLLEQALALPTDAPEAALLGKLHSAVRMFNEASERALEQSRGGNPSEARRTVRTEVWRLADAAGSLANDLVQYDVSQSEVTARHIEAAYGARSCVRLTGEASHA